MAFAAGLRLTADLLNSYVITNVGNAVITTNSSSTSGTTEVAAVSVTGTLVAGNLYLVTFVGHIAASGTLTSTETDFQRIREDSLTGTQQGSGQIMIPSTSGNGYSQIVQAQYTAVSTGTKLFVLTLQRTATPSGSGAHFVASSAGAPSIFKVDLMAS